MVWSRNVLGSGLTLWQYTAVLAISVALFLWWGGALWNAPPETSHVMRFAVSYLAIVPAAWLLLVAVRRFTWTRLLTTLGTVWAIKLVVTSGLYLVLAGGSATHLEPRRAEAGGRDAAMLGYAYAPAGDAFAAGEVEGQIYLGAAAAPSAVVMLDQPAPGESPGQAREVTLSIEHGRYRQPIYTATVNDRLTVANADDRLYTLNLVSSEGSAINRSVPAQTHGVDIAMPDPGVYSIRSDGGQTAPAWLIVVDHPYLAITDEDGRFELARVPAGRASLVAVAVVDGQLIRGARQVDIPEGARAGVELDIAQ